MTISFITAELLFAAVWLSVRIVVWIKNKRIDIRREALLLLMYLNFAVIIRFVFFPMERVDGRIQPLEIDPAAMLPFTIRWIPFVNMAKYSTLREQLLNIVGNIALFIPSGILLPIVCKKPDRFWKVTLAGFLISLSIEILQLPMKSRVSDVDDLILNTLGVIIGYGIYAMVKRLTGAGNFSKKSR